VCGAGDTVIATIAAAVVAGLPYDDAVFLASVAAGEVVAREGMVAVTPADLLRSLESMEQSDPTPVTFGLRTADKYLPERLASDAQGALHIAV
jgi:bifunctional ADP-heptose synthase (sugar kinase/adenylyltransferase)